MDNLILLPKEELDMRLARIREAARLAGATGCILIADNATLYYLTGRVFNGWACVPLERDTAPLWFVRRPVELQGDGVIYVRKVEEIPGRMAEAGVPLPARLGQELDVMPYSVVERVRKAIPAGCYFNASPIVAAARAVKTHREIALIRQSGIIHEAVYRKIPSLYSTGMTDFEFEVAIEHLSRLEGCLGIFRVSGQSMEIFMGNVLAGRNADVPTPYDFAMGGGGKHASLPVGASGGEIMPGTAVMVDVNGNYTGYMTDMTRTFACGTLPAEALAAHQCSIDICHAFQEKAREGVRAADLYDMAAAMAEAAGFSRYFMGHRQHAGFCGHGVGIEVNEQPVIAPRSKGVLEVGNVIALEPKFVIPRVGAVGIENTYAIGNNSVECLTNAPEEIIQLID